MTRARNVISARVRNAITCTCAQHHHVHVCAPSPRARVRNNITCAQHHHHGRQVERYEEDVDEEALREAEGEEEEEEEEAAPAVEPFNLKAEREGGSFDESGNYLLAKKARGRGNYLLAKRREGGGGGNLPAGQRGAASHTAGLSVCENIDIRGVRSSDITGMGCATS